MKILGVDPGTATTGYGMISAWGKKIKVLSYGCIKTEISKTPEKRLEQIYKQMKSLLKKEKPHIVSIEKLFFFKNMKTAMAVSQAKGVILMACSEKRIPVVEYAPLEVKQALAGYGRATKKDIQQVVKRILRLEEIPRPDDAADALAIALCHRYLKHKDNYQKIKKI